MLGADGSAERSKEFDHLRVTIDEAPNLMIDAGNPPIGKEKYPALSLYGKSGVREQFAGFRHVELTYVAVVRLEFGKAHFSGS